MKEVHGIWSEELAKRIVEEGSIQQIKEIPDNIKKVFVTAHDITPEWHVKIQAKLQENIDNSVSKTINCPKKTTVEEIENVYLSAWEQGCKGITIYRDGSREGQVLTIGQDKKEEPKEEKKEIVRTRKRPAITKGITPAFKTSCGNLYATINDDEKGICELFIQLGKTGGCTQSFCEALARTISLAFRSGVQINKVIEELQGIRCPSPCMVEGGTILSCSDAISKALKAYLKEKKQESKLEDNVSKADRGHNPTCPECGEMLTFKEGCVGCNSCGWSKCS